MIVHHCIRHRSHLKKGRCTVGFDGFKRITGTKIHVVAEQNGLPASVVCSSANEHDSTKFIGVLENTSSYLDESVTEKTITVYADKGYDAACIRNYLRCNGIGCCIPYKKSEHTVPENQQNVYNKTRFAVERFFGWLKNGFHRTRIRYEKKCENYLGLINIASFLMYCRVLR